MRNGLLIGWLAVLGCGGQSPAGSPSPSADLPPALSSIREDELRSDLYALAGDHFRGREAGTLDELRASAWLADRARQAGLLPAGDDGGYFQFWSLARTRPAAATVVRVGETALPLHSDVVIMSAAAAVIDAPLVADGALGDSDLAGKAVVVPITKPAAHLPADISIRPARYLLAFATETATRLAKAKPAAIILVSDPVADSAWAFVSKWYQGGSYGLEFGGPGGFGSVGAIPMIWVPQRARSIVIPGQRLRATLAFDRFLYPSVNVVAKVPGTDPALRGQYLLFSAHQDHDGVKAPVAGDSIWNGADDNASVSVGILAIGRAFVKRPARRSTLFVWHGAEEKGLLGSRYHAEHPMVPRDSIVAVLNADMIGANHPDTAALLGAQPPHLNSPELVAMGLRANAMVSRFVVDSLWDRPTHPEGWYFRSDHLPYARKGIPSLYFSSLPHPAYHTPLDEPSRINYPKLTRIVQWMYATGWLAANSPERVKALKTDAGR